MSEQEGRREYLHRELEERLSRLAKPNSGSLLRAAGEQEEFRRVFAFRAQGRLALRSHVQNSLLFGTWLLSGSRA